MEVHFCDICNESVPQRDLDLGRAFLRKGRVVCAACDHAMGGHAEADAPALAAAGPGPAEAAAETALGLDAPPAPAGAAPAPAVGYHPHGAPAGSGLAMVLAAMGILLTASVAVLLFERLDDSGRGTAIEIGRMQGELRAGMDELRDELIADERERGEELRGIATELGALAVRVEEREKAGAESASRLAADVAKLGERVERTAALAERVAAQDRRVEDLAATVAEMRGDIGLIAEKVLELEERPVAVMPAPGGPGSPGGAPEMDQPAWMSLVADLESPSSGARWAAVTALGDTGDPAVVSHLVPMLQDTDLFVRMATARVLGDLQSLEAVPALIDALEDDEPSVREQAVVSLRTLTAKNFKFDPTGNEAERAKKVKAWRDWWRREGESLAGRT